jgi:hypothetical protein
MVREPMSIPAKRMFTPYPLYLNEVVR